MSGADEARIETRREGHVLVITMVRERKRNAVDRLMADALDAALSELDDDDDLWAGVLAGGDAIFCAGSDLRSNGDYMTERGGEYGIIRRERRKPLIAAVEGAALGGGLEIVLSCDLVVASSAARFGLPEVSIGVIPTCAGIFRTPNALPQNVARELILTGEPIGAERAYQVGFVNRLVAPGETVAQALGLAERITRNAPLSVQGCLRSVNDWVGRGTDEGWALTDRAFETISGTEDQREGVLSFLEKRSPAWKAR